MFMPGRRGHSSLVLNALQQVGADKHRFDAFLHDGGHGAGDHERCVLDIQCVLDVIPAWGFGRINIE